MHLTSIRYVRLSQCREHVVAFLPLIGRRLSSDNRPLSARPWGRGAAATPGCYTTSRGSNTRDVLQSILSFGHRGRTSDYIWRDRLWSSQPPVAHGCGDAVRCRALFVQRDPRPVQTPLCAACGARGAISSAARWPLEKQRPQLGAAREEISRLQAREPAAAAVSHRRGRGPVLGISQNTTTPKRTTFP